MRDYHSSFITQSPCPPQSLRKILKCTALISAAAFSCGKFISPFAFALFRCDLTILSSSPPVQDQASRTRPPNGHHFTPHDLFADRACHWPPTTTPRRQPELPMPSTLFNRRAHPGIASAPARHAFCWLPPSDAIHYHHHAEAILALRDDYHKPFRIDYIYVVIMEGHERLEFLFT